MAKTLTVFLAADLKKFNGGMRDAQNQVNSFGGSLKNLLGPALIAAGAAAGAFAIKLGVDGVKAAAEDEKAVAALAQTLSNLNMAHDTQAVEDYIYELERAYGVADTDLRPAYDRLIRSTKDVEEANRALKLAMDISASTGKSLETVTDALGRAYDGNTVSLGRLGLGIDKAALASMSLDQITAQLAQTFGGQADVEAATFEGQLRRLTTATDNLKEAFGVGLLEALGDTNDTTQDLVDTMEGLEPIIKGIGREAGESAMGVAALAAELADLAPAADSAGDRVLDLGNQMHSTFSVGGILDAPQNLANIISLTRWLTDSNYRLEQRLAVTQKVIDDHVDYLDAFARGNYRAAQSQIALNDAADAGVDEVSDYRFEVIGAQGALMRMYSSLIPVNEEMDENRRVTGGASKATEEYTKKQKALIDTYETQGIAFATSKQELIEQIAELQRATEAVETYADSIQQDLLSGIDFEGLYKAQFDKEGKNTGQSWFDGFDEAINQAEWFGNVLTNLKSRGLDQRFIEELASLGPLIGGELGQEMIDGGQALIDTMNEKWVGVQDKTRELALGLVPEFLEAGRLSAIDALNGLATQFAEDQRKFKKLGGQLGLQVGAQFKTRMLDEIRDAVRQVEALATAARAEAVARAEAEQARITEQAVATAISNLIRNSDQRAGRNPQPVLQ